MEDPRAAAISRSDTDRRTRLVRSASLPPDCRGNRRQVTGAFVWDETPSHLIRGRDKGLRQPIPIAFGQRGSAIIRLPRAHLTERLRGRLIGSIRRERLDHLVVSDEAQSRRVLRNYPSYYKRVRTPLSLEKDAPGFRRMQKIGRIAVISILDGLHHQYARV
jgi:putative transposase